MLNFEEISTTWRSQTWAELVMLVVLLPLHFDPPFKKCNLLLSVNQKYHTEAKNDDSRMHLIEGYLHSQLGLAILPAGGDADEP